MFMPYGLCVYNVLAVGLSLASDVFKSTIRDIIKDLEGVINIADNLLVYGRDDEHNRNLLALLDKCSEIGLTLNKEAKIQMQQCTILWKCQYR